MHTLTKEQKIENLVEERNRLMEKDRRIKELVESINKKIEKLESSSTSSDTNNDSALETLTSYNN